MGPQRPRARIAEGQLQHEAPSPDSCGTFTPEKYLFCDVPDVRQRRCMVATSTNASACDTCLDAATPKTFRVAPNHCTGFQCQPNELWCPLPEIGCFGTTGTSCSTCYSGSLELAVEGGILCALPCEVSVDVPNLIVETGALTVTPGSSINVLCDVGTAPEWDESSGGPRTSQLNFTCPRGNTQLDHRISELSSYPACRPTCAAGTVQDDDFNTYSHGDMLHKQAMNLTCDTSRYESGMVWLQCMDGAVQIASSTCQARLVGSQLCCQSEAHV